ncbi:MAG: hypothetical protein LC687_04660 [Actinobacteria bacterium]|nr:hypothetical protein [Actinomycetota bacterium]
MTFKEKLMAEFPGLCPCEALKRISKRDKTIADAAADYGMTDTGLRAAKRRWGCGFKWPRSTAERVRKSKSSARRVEVKHFGEMMSLGEIARIHGLKPNTVFDRYKKGLRNEDLCAQPRRGGQVPEIYELDMPQSEWQHVIEYAQTHGLRRASDNLGIPAGAINCALKGEWHRLD